MQKYWSVNLTGISIGNAAAKPLPGLNASSAILDSGTHFIIATDADAKAINTVRSGSARALSLLPLRCATWFGIYLAPLLLCELLLQKSPPIRPTCLSMSFPGVAMSSILCRHRGQTMFLQTGLQGLIGSRESPTAVSQGIRGLQYSPDQNNWYVQSGCLNIDSLPTIVLRFGSLPFALTPRQYISQVALDCCVMAL